MGSAAQSELRIQAVCERLQRSREEIFGLAHGLIGGFAAQDGEAPFPRSRLMRLLTGNGGRLLVGGAALAASLLRPSLLRRATKATGLLRPLLLRYVLPRLLR